ncbi:MAG: hypothetical protein VX699_01805, partial [Myxococcota bacterium]|nr:hypothetical protein [Myxococcota bacterium]
LPQKQDQAVRSHVDAAVKKLQNYQLSNGGFGYWEGQHQVNDWSTSYIGHFLVEAQNAGFSVPSEMLDKWTNHQREVAGAWTPENRYERSSLMQAYRLYTLALRGKPALSAMNRFKENATLSTTAQWRLAAAYQLAGQPRIAAALTKDISPEVQNYHELSGTFGSTLRDRAMILETLVLLGRTKEALISARLISEELSTSQWLNTQATAFSLVALARFGINEKSGSLIDVSYTLNKDTALKLLSSKPVTEFKFSPTNKESDNLKLVNEGTSPVFVSVHVTGLPVLGQERSSENLLRMTVNYFDSNQHPIDLSSIEQGTDFVAEVEVTNLSTRTLSELALSHLFPSGWEIHNERLSGASKKSSGFDYQDIRDDRVYTYFSLPRGQSRTFKTTLNASYAGKFYLPMVGVEAMYDATLHSYHQGRWVEVFAPKPTN